MAYGLISRSAIQSNDKMLQGPSSKSRPDDVLALRQRASETPDAIALLAPGRDPLTYLKLWNHIQSFTQGAGELRPGEVTALGMPGGPELITAFLAVASTGASAPLDPTLTEAEYHFYLSRSVQKFTNVFVARDQRGVASLSRSWARSRRVNFHSKGRAVVSQ